MRKRDCCRVPVIGVGSRNSINIPPRYVCSFWRCERANIIRLCCNEPSHQLPSTEGSEKGRHLTITRTQHTHTHIYTHLRKCKQSGPRSILPSGKRYQSPLVGAPVLPASIDRSISTNPHLSTAHCIAHHYQRTTKKGCEGREGEEGGEGWNSGARPNLLNRSLHSHYGPVISR